MKILEGNTYPIRDVIKARGGKWMPNAKVWKVPDEHYEELAAMIKPCGKSEYKSSASKKAGEEHFQGQLWEECSCGNEPVYMPSHKCEKCINRIWGS